jgi:hypothetical protein
MQLRRVKAIVKNVLKRKNIFQRKSVQPTWRILCANEGNTLRNDEVLSANTRMEYIVKANGCFRED